MSDGEMLQCIQSLQALRSRRKKFISLMILLTTTYPLHTARQAISSDWTISVTAIPKIISIGKDTPVSSSAHKSLFFAKLMIQAHQGGSTSTKWRNQKAGKTRKIKRSWGFGISL